MLESFRTRLVFGALPRPISPAEFVDNTLQSRFARPATAVSGGCGRVRHTDGSSLVAHGPMADDTARTVGHGYRPVGVPLFACGWLQSCGAGDGWRFTAAQTPGCVTFATVPQPGGLANRQPFRRSGKRRKAPAPEALARLLCPGDAGVHAFANALPLKLRKGAE